ncbi:alpha/beta fold hydrolase [Leucobacter luti]|uniref:alpha/beta fold hydrolase n=1 Tax=Leucobacter luti TaxID=340320 RepID=UPI003D06F824
MGSVEKVIFLHGIGEDRDAWDWQIQRLPAGFEGEAADILSAENHGRKTFSTSEVAARIWDSVDEPHRVHLCGLSLGAMISLEMIRIAPDRVASLTLAGGQVRPPRGLMALQRSIVRLLPSRGLQKSGVSKQLILDVLRDVSRMDFRSLLPAIQVPALVVCGQRDLANIPAARELASSISGARLELLAGAGHQAQLDAPEKFSALLSSHLLGIERS